MACVCPCVCACVCACVSICLRQVKQFTLSALFLIFVVKMVIFLAFTFKAASQILAIITNEERGKELSS